MVQPSDLKLRFSMALAGALSEGAEKDPLLVPLFKARLIVCASVCASRVLSWITFDHYRFFPVLIH